MTHEAAREAYARSLEAWDAALCSSLAEGTVVRGKRRRKLARRQARVEDALAKAGPTASQIVQSDGRG